MTLFKIETRNAGLGTDDLYVVAKDVQSAWDSVAIPERLISISPIAKVKTASYQDSHLSELKIIELRK